METLIDFFTRHAAYAHLFVFGAILLAGMNIPISIDLVIILSATLASNVIPEKTIHLYLSVLTGCLLSAWIAYWIGRLFGPKLCKLRFFKKIMPPERIEKVKNYYDKHAFLTLLIGRFMPFGIRNCIFMSSGISKFPFRKFVIRDLVACFTWSSLYFYLIFTLGQNVQTLYHYAKKFNLLIFIAFLVTVIAIIWYKKKTRAKLIANRESVDSASQNGKNE